MFCEETNRKGRINAKKIMSTSIYWPNLNIIQNRETQNEEENVGFRYKGV